MRQMGKASQSRKQARRRKTQRYQKLLKRAERENKAEAIAKRAKRLGVSLEHLERIDNK